MKNYFNYYGTATNGMNVFFCTDNDEVKEGKVVAQDITIREEGGDLVGLTIETEDKEQHNMSYKLCYATIEDYRRNFPITLSSIKFYHAFKDLTALDDKPIYYCIENGQVVSNEVEIKHVRAEWTEKHGWVFSSPEIPTGKQMYDDPIVAEQMCTTTWTDENGKKHTKEGLLALLLLDDEQKTALQAFKDAMQRCKDLKIGIGFCTDSNRLYAWSKAKVKDAYFSYDLDEGEAAQFFDAAVFDNFDTDMCLDYIGCDDTMCVVRKDEDEQPQQAE